MKQKTHRRNYSRKKRYQKKSYMKGGSCLGGTCLLPSLFSMTSIPVGAATGAALGKSSYNIERKSSSSSMSMKKGKNKKIVREDSYELIKKLSYQLKSL